MNNLKLIVLQNQGGTHIFYHVTRRQFRSNQEAVVHFKSIESYSAALPSFTCITALFISSALPPHFTEEVENAGGTLFINLPIGVNWYCITRIVVNTGLGTDLMQQNTYYGTIHFFFFSALFSSVLSSRTVPIAEKY